MKKLLICVVLSGCGPISLSADANWGIGGNQKFKKTVEVDQNQTAEQSQSQTDIAEAIIKVIPFLTADPTPTPTPLPPKIKSITIELEPKAVPEIPIYTKQPYLPRAKKAKPCIPRTCP